MSDISWSSPYTGSSEAVTNVEVLWITDSVFVVCWINSTRTTAYASVYNSSGSHLHSQSLFSDSFYQYHQIQLAKVRDNMWVLAYSEDSGFATTRLRSLTWTGSAITDNGQIAVLNNQQTWLSAVCNEGDDKIMLWGRRFDAAHILQAVYGTYNGSSWSFSSISSISGSYYADEIRACQASAGKGFLLWDKDPNDDTVCHGFGNLPGGGTDITAVDGTDELRHLHCCKIADDKIIIAGHCPNEPDGGRAYAVTLSSNKPTVGTRLVFNPDHISWNPNCSRIDDTHVLIAFEDASDSGKGKTVLCEIDWDTLILTPGDTEIFSENDIGGGGAYGLGLDSNSSGLMALAYRDESDSDYLKVMVGEYVTVADPPTGISVVGGEGENTITFTVDPEADDTHIYWANSPGVSPGTGTKISSVSSPYVHEDLNASLVYYYVLTSENEAGEGDASAEYNDSPYPAIPENLAVDADIEKNTITWDASLGADSYNLYWSTSPGVDKLDNKITGVTSPYEHSPLTPGIPIYYAVAAEDEDGESSLSSEESGTPELDEPENLDVSLETPTSTMLTWDSVTGATTYNIYYKKSAGVTKLNGTKIAGVSSPYEHTGLDDGDTYYYIVTAENASDESDESNEVNEYILPIPATPDVTPLAGDSENTLSWEDAENADTYNIYWSLTSGVTILNGTKIENVTSPYSHEDLSRQYYYYIVTSVNDYYESEPSAEIELMPQFEGKIFDHDDQAKLRLLYQYQKE